MVMRAKFYVSAVADNAPQGGKVVSKSVTMFAVGGIDNKKWAEYTPGGSLQMTIDNPALIGEKFPFKAGSYVYLDISEAPEKDLE